MSEWDDAILIGVVARTHGNRGEVVVNPETDFPEERFREGAQLMARGKDGSPATLEVVTMRMHQGRPVILFKGIASMNDAELLAGRNCESPKTSSTRAARRGRVLPSRPDWLRGGHRERRIDRRGHGGRRRPTAQTRLVVRSRRNEVLIPLADEICTVDLAAKRITVRPPEGLLEVNGEWR